jgi:putative flippase GtrA
VRQTTREQTGKFAIIGAIGFIVDGGILTILHSVYYFDLLVSRLASFSFAVTVTWYLNRHRTFAENKNQRAALEWSRYAAVNSVGALLNMSIFFSLVHRFELMAEIPLLPLAISALIALIFNFLASKHVVFRGQRS